MITVVVPTMWRVPSFPSFLKDVASHPVVSEVIVIDNDPSTKPGIMDIPGFLPDNTSVVTMGQNIGVNAAWNLGIQQSRNNFVCVMNDDVVFDLRLLRVMDEVMEADPEFGVAGAHPGEKKFNQVPFTNGMIDVVEHFTRESTAWHFGFGTLFFVRKDRWVEIPSNLFIYYGDDWVFETQKILGNRNYLITNFLYATDSAQTCTSIFTEQEREEILVSESLDYALELGNFKNIAFRNFLEREYDSRCHTESDINEHLPTLFELTQDPDVNLIVELGVRYGNSTSAFLISGKTLYSYDLVKDHYVQHMFDTAFTTGARVYYTEGDSLNVDIPLCDMLFIDTNHVFDQLYGELARHGNKCSKYIVMHDTETYKHELLPAIDAWLKENPHWGIKQVYDNNNGLTVLERRK